MSVKKINTTWFSNIIVFNKALYAVISINLLAYTFQINFKYNIITNILILIIWMFLFINILMNESSSQLNKKYKKKNVAVIKMLTRANIFSSFLLIMTVTFFTGDTNFLYLSSIPIIYSLLSSFRKQTFFLLVASIFLLTWADYSGWLHHSFLVVNQSLKVPPVLSYSTVMGLILLLGFIFSNYVQLSSKRTKKLYTLATRDPLTGLLNKRELNRRLVEEMARARRHNSALTLALFDLDFFKKINDKFGHVAGDFVLKELGKLIMENTRTSDISARYGGEEFALILPETNEQKAFELLERIRLKVQNNPFYYSYIPINATLSIGITQFNQEDTNVEIFFQRADKALYSAKNNGRNRVEVLANPVKNTVTLSMLAN